MKRIFNVIIYTLSIILFIWLFLIFQSYLVIYTIVLLVLFPIVSYIVGKYTAGQIGISVEGVNDEIDSNQEFVITFIIDNPTFIPIVDANIYCKYKNLYYDFEEKVIISVPLYARGKQTVRLPVKSEYCGMIQIEIDKVTIWDMLHMWYAKCDVKVDNMIALYPVIKEELSINPNVYVCGNNDSEESHKKGNDFSEINEIREYIPGDSLKSIHWKLSAKKEELMVKEHISMSSKQISILIELYNDDHYILDSIMKLAYSVTYNLAVSNIPYTVYWWSDRVQEMKSKTILSVYDINDCFKELFYENPYKDINKGYDEFLNIEHFIEYIICVGNIDYSNTLESITMDNRAYLSYREVE